MFMHRFLDVLDFCLYPSTEKHFSEDTGEQYKMTTVQNVKQKNRNELRQTGRLIDRSRNRCRSNKDKQGKRNRDIMTQKVTKVDKQHG